MNPRERILAICLVGALVVAGLGMVVKWAVIERWQDLDDDMQKAVAKEAELRNRLAVARTAETEWAEFTPLSHNPDRAEQRFRQDISELLERHDLSADVTIRALPRRTLKSGFTEVRLSIQASGRLSELIGFQCDFYRLKYFARLEQINITAEDQGRGRRRALTSRVRSSRGASRTDSADQGEVRLNLNMTATALVLPKVGDLEQDTAGPMGPVAPEDRGRLPRPPDEYAAIAANNIFEPWRPAAQVVKPVETPDTESAKRTRIEPVPPLPPPRPDKVLSGVMSTNGLLEVSVRDEDRLDLPPERLGINDPVDDGTLVLVNPRGMVVQVEEQRGSAFEYAYYFYKLGARFSERVELNPQIYPEIHEELEKALVPLPLDRAQPGED